MVHGDCAGQADDSRLAGAVRDRPLLAHKTLDAGDVTIARDQSPACVAARLRQRKYRLEIHPQHAVPLLLGGAKHHSLSPIPALLTKSVGGPKSLATCANAAWTSAKLLTSTRQGRQVPGRVEAKSRARAKSISKRATLAPCSANNRTQAADPFGTTRYHDALILDARIHLAGLCTWR